MLGGGLLGGLVGLPLTSLGLAGIVVLDSAEETIKDQDEIQSPEELKTVRKIVVGGVLVPGIVILVASAAMVTFGAIRMSKYDRWKEGQMNRATARRTPKPSFSPYLGATRGRTGMLGLSGKF